MQIYWVQGAPAAGKSNTQASGHPKPDIHKTLVSIRTVAITILSQLQENVQIFNVNTMKKITSSANGVSAATANELNGNFDKYKEKWGGFETTAIDIKKSVTEKLTKPETPAKDARIGDIAVSARNLVLGMSVAYYDFDKSYNKLMAVKMLLKAEASKAQSHVNQMIGQHEEIDHKLNILGNHLNAAKELFEKLYPASKIASTPASGSVPASPIKSTPASPSLPGTPAKTTSIPASPTRLTSSPNKVSSPASHPSSPPA